MATDWVQLPMVEPGGRTTFKPRPRDNENDFQIQAPEGNRGTDETQMKAKTMNPINKFPPAQTPAIFTDQFTINRTTKYNENDQPDTHTHISELNLNKNDPVITTSVPKSYKYKPNSAENNYGAQMPEMKVTFIQPSAENNYAAQKLEEKVTFIQPSHQLQFKSDLETKESDNQIPQSKEYLTNLTLNTPKFPIQLDLEVTPMHADVKHPYPVTVKHHSGIKDSASRFSNTFYNTKTTPDPVAKTDNKNTERIVSSTESKASSTEDESEASWISGTGTSNNKTEENTAQDVISPLDMLKAVHRTMIQEMPSTLRGKMHFLQQLKNKMLWYIGKVNIFA